MGSFSLDLSRFCKNANADMQTVIRKISFEAFRRIVLRTPVDTGRARANWGVAIGTPGTTYDITLADKSGQATLAKAADGTMGWNCRGSIFLTNNLPYIGALEYGHSQVQAPNGMVRVTMEEMIAWCNNAANIKQSISGIRNEQEVTDGKRKD